MNLFGKQVYNILTMQFCERIQEYTRYKKIANRNKKEE